MPGVYPWKGTFRCRNSLWLDQKFRIKLVLFRNKNSIFLFFAIQFCARETARGPKKNLFLEWVELGSLGLRGISPRLNMTATHPENLILRFFRYPQNVISKFSVDPFWMDDPKVLFRDENSGRLQVTFFEFSLQPEVSPIIITTTENMEKKDITFAICKRYLIPTSGTTPLCRRQVAVNIIREIKLLTHLSKHWMHFYSLWHFLPRKFNAENENGWRSKK